MATISNPETIRLSRLPEALVESATSRPVRYESRRRVKVRDLWWLRDVHAIQRREWYAGMTSFAAARTSGTTRSISASVVR